MALLSLTACQNSNSGVSEESVEATNKAVNQKVLSLVDDKIQSYVGEKTGDYEYIDRCAAGYDYEKQALKTSAGVICYAKDDAIEFIASYSLEDDKWYSISLEAGDEVGATFEDNKDYYEAMVSFMLDELYTETTEEEKAEILEVYRDYVDDWYTTGKEEETSNKMETYVGDFWIIAQQHPSKENSFKFNVSVKKYSPIIKGGY